MHRDHWIGVHGLLLTVHALVDSTLMINTIHFAKLVRLMCSTIAMHCSRKGVMRQQHIQIITILASSTEDRRNFVGARSPLLSANSLLL
jgi:hypothetical protein